jgi:hypothetical protein
MSAGLIFDPLAELSDPEFVERCRFCNCTEDEPCIIAVTEDSDGKVRLARTPEEMDGEFPCSWYVLGVCNAPACVEKLIAESRLLLFGADGRKLA